MRKQTLFLLCTLCLTTAVFAQDKKVVVNENGNMGVGTETPTHKLDVNGNAYVAKSLQIGSALLVGAGVEAQSAKINQNMEVAGQIKVGTLEVGGLAVVNGLRAGSLVVENQIETNLLSVSGQVNMNGKQLLNLPDAIYTNDALSYGYALKKFLPSTGGTLYNQLSLAPGALIAVDTNDPDPYYYSNQLVPRSYVDSVAGKGAINGWQLLICAEAGVFGMEGLVAEMNTTRVSWELEFRGGAYHSDWGAYKDIRLRIEKVEGIEPMLITGEAGVGHPLITTAHMGESCVISPLKRSDLKIQILIGNGQVRIGLTPYVDWSAIDDGTPAFSYLSAIVYYRK